jgi:prepilin-type N-terminal cleavage/methylation domain-containing protein
MIRAATTRAAIHRRGLTLLEVILAVAILGVSMAALGGLVSLGARSAEEAREGTTAQILCESLMNEVTAGSLPAESIGPVAYDEEGRWLYTILVQPVQNPPLPLLEVRVLVEQGLVPGTPISFELVRWMPDPSVELPADAAAGAATDEAALEMEGF